MGSICFFLRFGCQGAVGLVLLSFLGQPLEPGKDSLNFHIRRFSPNWWTKSSQPPLDVCCGICPDVMPVLVHDFWLKNHADFVAGSVWRHWKVNKILDKTLGKTPPGGIPMLCKCRSPWVAARRCTNQTNSFLTNYRIIILHQHWLGQLFLVNELSSWNTSTQQKLTHSRCKMI